jgi:hypothetical protein
MEVVLEPVEISDDLSDRPLGLLLRRSRDGRLSFVPTGPFFG